MSLVKCENCKGLFDENDLKLYTPEYSGFWDTLFKSKKVCPRCYEELKKKEHDKLFHSETSERTNVNTEFSDDIVPPPMGIDIIDAMIYVMVADGEIDERELAQIEAAFIAVPELSALYPASIIGNVIQEEYTKLLRMGKDKFLLGIRESIGTDFDRKIKCLAFAAGVAFADGNFHEKEKEALQKLATILTIPKEIYQEILGLVLTSYENNQKK